MRPVPKQVGLLYVVLVGVFLTRYIARGQKVDHLGTVVSAFTALLALPAAVVAVIRSGKTGPVPARPGWTWPTSSPRRYASSGRPRPGYAA
ncbi:hypothetical protein [Streptomyces sp. NPDC101165]|uniref:hypothetical protein n=1 Tax=Streptomyces sp. NPDC101165 TaxID=3366119 RepID=UPI003811F7EC